MLIAKRNIASFTEFVEWFHLVALVWFLIRINWKIFHFRHIWNKNFLHKEIRLDVNTFDSIENYSPFRYIKFTNTRKYQKIERIYLIKTNRATKKWSKTKRFPGFWHEKYRMNEINVFFSYSLALISWSQCTANSFIIYSIIAEWQYFLLRVMHTRIKTRRIRRKQKEKPVLMSV